MDLSRIKQFVKQNGDKFIFVENGEPEVVMMSFREYEKMLSKNGTHTSPASVPVRDAREKMPLIQPEPSPESYAPFPLHGFQVEEETILEVEPFEMTPEKPILHEQSRMSGRLEHIRLEDLPI